MREKSQETSYTLAELQKKLNIEQHRLIHLCEKEVIIPDFGDSAGRGTVRRFSNRNIFEFVVALELRSYAIPVAYVATIIRIIRAFEVYGGKQLKLFHLPGSLQEKPFIKVRLAIVEGHQVYFNLVSKGANTWIGGLNLNDANGSLRAGRSDPTIDCRSFLEIDLNKLAAEII